jgi:hypothetical protein
VNLGRIRRPLPAADAHAVGVVERDGGVWHLFSDGGLLPVVRGGAPDPEDPPKEDPPADPPKTYTQAELDRMLAREKDQGGRAGEKALLKKLGLPEDTKPEAVKAILDEKKAEDDKQKSEAARAKEAADAAKAASDKEKADAATERHQAAVERHLVRAGVGAGETDDVKLAKAIERAAKLVEVEKGADPEAIAAAVADLKKDMPTLFTAAATDGQQPDGDVKTQTRKASDGNKSGIERGKAKAAELGWVKQKQTA